MHQEKHSLLPRLWVPRDEHFSLPEGGKTDAGIPDPSWLTSTLGFVASESPPERERHRAVCLSEGAVLYHDAQVPFPGRGSEEGEIGENRVCTLWSQYSLSETGMRGGTLSGNSKQ